MDNDILVIASDGCFFCLCFFFLLICCLGLWDVMQNEEVMDILFESGEENTPQELCDILLSKVKEKNLNIKNSDNTTILITKFSKVSSVVVNLSELTSDTTPTASWRTDSATSSSNTSNSPINGSILRSDTPVLEYSED